YFLPMYSASKCAVLGFSQSLASMYDKTGVRVIIMCPGLTATPLVTNINSRIHDSIRPIVTNEIAYMENMPKQTCDNVALGVLNLIQKGKNGAAWISDDNQPPCDVSFPHYSKRCTPV
ncbi:PREDICTED: alcohol dehydrogenase-like, partial [Trachymyrmex septentrionalis]